jgi:hypothetical protein
MINNYKKNDPEMTERISDSEMPAYRHKLFLSLVSTADPLSELHDVRKD